jgi:hypothetical protein
MAFDKNDPELKVYVESLVDDAVSGLKTKNIDLASRLEKARAGKTIDPDEHRQLEETLAKLETELNTANKALKQSGIELEKTRKDNESQSAFTTRLLVDNGLVDALTKAGVTNPVQLKAAKAMLQGDVKLTIDGDIRKAMIGDKELTAAITEWAGSDEGKHFVTAANNSGGGALGGTGKPASADIMKLSAMERMVAGRRK